MFVHNKYLPPHYQTIISTKNVESVAGDDEACYKKEIPDTDWVQEVVTERFDGAPELLTKNSIIYGGAIRDCLSGKPLEGDLDIAIPPREFSIMTQLFIAHPKWVESEEKATAEVSNSRDIAAARAPMNCVTSLKNVDGQEAQLIQSIYGDKDPLESAMMVARMVDIICCGVALTADGKVFEVVPGAYEQCREGVLRINKDSDTIYLKALQSRVDKLVGRGWKNEIDVKKTIAKVEEKRKRENGNELANIVSKYFTIRSGWTIKSGLVITATPKSKPINDLLHNSVIIDRISECASKCGFAAECQLVFNPHGYSQCEFRLRKINKLANCAELVEVIDNIVNNRINRSGKERKKPDVLRERKKPDASSVSSEMTSPSWVTGPRAEFDMRRCSSSSFISDSYSFISKKFMDQKIKSAVSTRGIKTKKETNENE